MSTARKDSRWHSRSCWTDRGFLVHDTTTGGQPTVASVPEHEQGRPEADVFGIGIDDVVGHVVEDEVGVAARVWEEEHFVSSLVTST